MPATTSKSFDKPSPGQRRFGLAPRSRGVRLRGRQPEQSWIGEADLVDCMVALPGQLFHSRQIPVCLWFCRKNITLDSANDARLFDGETELSLVA
jgi:hypothetical protein